MRDDMVTLHSPVTAEQLAHLKPGDPVELQGDGSILTGDLESAQSVPEFLFFRVLGCLFPIRTASGNMPPHLARHGCKLTIPTPPQAGAR